MNINLIVFAVILSIFLALLEIQIEGENGWAGKLPTWKIKNPFGKFLNWPYITGYHVFLGLFLFFCLQLPFFIDFAFNLKNEILIIEVFFIIMLLEDLFWFVFNPRWGVKKFFTEDIWWQTKKFLFLPKNYWVGIIIFIILELIRTRV
jgi:hypothetical protein